MKTIKRDVHKIDIIMMTEFDSQIEWHCHILAVFNKLEKFGGFIK